MVYSVLALLAIIVIGLNLSVELKIKRLQKLIERKKTRKSISV